MALSAESIKKALDIKEKALKKAEYLYEKSLQDATANNKRISEINSQLSNIGASLMMLALHGDTEQIASLREKSEALSKEKNELLKKAGVKEKQFFCSVCCDTGYIGGHLCQCIETLAKEIALKEMAETMPLDSCDFESFLISYYPEETQNKMNNILRFSKSYAENFSNSSENLLFMGKSGLGKTHLSLSIVKEVVSKGFDVIYGPAQSLFNDAEKEHFSYNGATEKRDRLLEADLLVIDDLGTEFMTNFVQSLFYDIVNTRLLKGKPTIINTNLTIDELESRYTARITSRFIGQYTIKSFVGNDIRLIKKAEEKQK